MSKSKNGPVVLDGSNGEGGGQILRSGLTLSMLTGRPFRMVRIRANRDKPGLRPQHLTAVEASALLCGAEVSGAAVGARELRFDPGPVDARDLTIDIGTAGSTALVLHTLFLPMALRSGAARTLALVGGTYNTKAPSYPFLESTWAPHMRDLGLSIRLLEHRPGFYPRGGGRIVAEIAPAERPRAIVGDHRRGSVAITAEAVVSNLDESIGRRMIGRAADRLAELGHELAGESVVKPRVGSPGAAVALTATTETTRATFVGLGERGKPAEAVADEAVEELLAHLAVPDAAVDPHSADQLLLPLALAEGRSVFSTSEVTEHLRTNAETISAFLDVPIRIEEGTEDRPPRVIVG